MQKNNVVTKSDYLNVFGVNLDLEVPKGDEPINATERYIARVENYCNNRLELFEIEERINITKMLYLLMMGMMFIVFSMILNNKVNIIVLEIISTIGSFSIWESANSWFIERKVIRLNKLKLLRLKNSKIIFKYETK